jgi:uncharacterized protein YeaC (DUF1315 family)
MDYQQLIANITPDIHAALKRAIEIGRWPDGRRLDDEQRALCMEAVIAWETIHLAERERTGFIDRGSKAEDEVCASHDESHDHEHTPQPLTWK